MKEDIIAVPVLNIEFIYYLIYLFFQKIYFFITSPFTGQEESPINFINIFKYANEGTVFDQEKYNFFGNGIGAIYDGYSLFTPPHGLESFGGFFGWLDNFFNNPYCSECPSFFNLFFGGLNSYLYMAIIIAMLILLVLKYKMAVLDQKEEILFETVYSREEKNEINDKAKKWDEIQRLIESDSRNDWVAAIIKADNLLEEVLEENGYYGENFSDRLKNANFKTLNEAWSAHKARNKIVHQSDYHLLHHEAKMIIDNYAKVFSEFYHL